MKKYRYHITGGLFLLYITILLYICLHNFSDAELPAIRSFLGIPADKCFHFLMFLPYPLICWFYLRFHRRVRIGSNYLFTAILLSGILLGALTECLQEWLTTYREGDLQDWGADMLGILAGCAVTACCRKMFVRMGNRFFSREAED